MTGSGRLVWLGGITLILILAQFTAFGPELWQSPWGVIQDDGRHFIAWLRQMGDPVLFPNDPIAEYFLALTPALYKALYTPAVWLGVDIVAWSMLVITPLSIGAFMLAANSFIAHMQLGRAESILLILLILADTFYREVATGLPRGFGPTILFGALALFLSKKVFWLAIIMALGANMYPIAAIVAGGSVACTVALRMTIDRKIDMSAVALVAAAAIGGIIGLTPFIISTAGFGDTISLAEARELPIFQPGGRTTFFREDWIETAFCSWSRSGVLPICTGGPGWRPLVLTLAVLILSYPLLRSRGMPNTFLILFAGICITGIVTIGLSYVFAFDAHLPGRYRKLTLQVIFLIVVMLGLTSALRWGAKRVGYAEQNIYRALIVVLMGAAVISTRNNTRLERDPAPLISQALRELPPETVVAGISKYADSLPAFAGRITYFSYELSVPYKKLHYQLMEERANILAELYTGPIGPNWAVLVNKSGIDYFVIEKSDTQLTRQWARSFPALKKVPSRTVFDAHPEIVSACTRASQNDLILVQVDCFVERNQEIYPNYNNGGLDYR
jgi:hypothetical protein